MRSCARFRFYEELNDFLPPARRKLTFEHCFDRRASIKDMIESFGVPHTEVELILVDGRSVDFSHIVGDGDHVSVYPVFESFNIRPLLKLRPEPMRRLRFVADANVGRLARYLRLLGFDCLYKNNWRDGEVATVAQDEHRVVLTRDRMLLRRKGITHGRFVRADRPLEQVREVLSRFDLLDDIVPFGRCVRCNGELAEVAKPDIEHCLEPKTRLYYEDFHQCRDCGRIYWQGSHFQRAQRLLQEMGRG